MSVLCNQWKTRFWTLEHHSDMLIIHLLVLSLSHIVQWVIKHSSLHSAPFSDGTSADRRVADKKSFKVWLFNYLKFWNFSRALRWYALLYPASLWAHPCHNFCSRSLHFDEQSRTLEVLLVVQQLKSLYSLPEDGNLCQEWLKFIFGDNIPSVISKLLFVFPTFYSRLSA